MGSEAAGRAPMPSLKELVEHYATLAGKFGEPVALSAFGLSEADTQNVFSALDEDYHISRFLHFSNANAQQYLINGEIATHVALEAAIYSLL
jgi:hypothetical protein